MENNIWPTIHSERGALADDLADLRDDQWQTQSLCTDWTVHDVLAHQLATAEMTPPKFIGKFAAAGFNFDRFAAKEVAREGAGGPAATLAAFRAASGRTSAPPGPKPTWLGEVIVHGEDIRRPLGIKHDYPIATLARAAEYYRQSDQVVLARGRVRDLRLVATDGPFAAGPGDGPLVSGPTPALIMAMTGRASCCDDLDGAGVEILRARCTG